MRKEKNSARITTYSAQLKTLRNLAAISGIECLPFFISCAALAQCRPTVLKGGEQETSLLRDVIGEASFFSTLNDTFRLVRPSSPIRFHSPQLFFNPLPNQLEESARKVLSESLEFLESLGPYDLGSLYEWLTSPNTAKQVGMYYTPSHLCTLMVDKAVALFENYPRTCLDPACGGGAFLLSLFRGLHQREDLPLVAGVDRDPLAIEIAQIALQIAFRKVNPSLHVGNSLLTPEDVGLFPNHFPFQPFSWRESFPEVFERGGFDIIVGNPPYGLARGEKISKEENSLLLQVYQPIREGKIDKYLLFMARGFQLLSPGGVLSFVVPNSWLGIKGAKRIRELFLRERSLVEVTLLDAHCSFDASVEPVVFFVKKGAGRSTVTLSEAHGRAFSIRKRGDIPVSECCAERDYIIPRLWTPEYEKVVLALRERTVPLASLFRPMIALQAYTVGKGTPPQTLLDVKEKVYHRTFSEDQHTIPYLEGRDVSRFSIDWSGKFLRHGPWLAEPQSLARFTGPRVLVREILGKYPYFVITAFTHEPYLYNKSILHILPRVGISEDDLLALTGILNSRFASFLLRVTGRKVGRRLFPKILNDDLKAFPIPKDLPSAQLSRLIRHSSPNVPCEELERMVCNL